MKSKRSSRLIAWLLTLVMILNIMPMSAVAEVKSNQITGPTYPVLETLGTGAVPNEPISGYTIQYIITGDYTYDGSNIVIREEPGTKENPSQEEPVTIAGCENAQKNTAKWDETNKILQFFPVPNTQSVELRYELVFENTDGSLDIRTFQIMQNGEGKLIWDKTVNPEVKESLEFKEFLKAVYGQTGGDYYTLSSINGVSIKQILPFVLPSDYTTDINNFPVTSSFTDNREGRAFTITYMGHDDGRGLEGNINIDEINPNQFTWNGQSKVCLYYRLRALEDDPNATYYTITWLNDDNSELAKTRVRAGVMPVYPNETPSKSNPESNKVYTFKGWDRKVVPATEDTT